MMLRVVISVFSLVVCAFAQLTPPPSCGALCLEQAIADSPCSATNRTCICTNAELTRSAEACVVQTCTIKESLSTKNYSMATCSVPWRDERWSTLWLGMGFFIVSVVAFALRMLSRWVCETGLYWDDYFMVGAIISGAGFAVTSIPLYVHSLGQDIWTLPFHDITYMLIAYYHGEWVYQLAVFFTMTSLLLFYLRIFPIKNIRIQVYVVMGAVALYSALGIVISINQCTPVRGAWEYWHGEEKFACSNRNALGWASAIIKIILDVAIIVLPVRPLSKLGMSVKKKVQVMLMFAVGLFVTLVSMLRLSSLAHFADSHNATWDYKAMGFWSQIEVHVGNVCACMPGIYSLLKYFWPKVIGSKKDTTDPYTMESIKPANRGQSRLRSDIDDEENFTHLDDASSKERSNVAVNETRLYDST